MKLYFALLKKNEISLYKKNEIEFGCTYTYFTLMSELKG